MLSAPSPSDAAKFIGHILSIINSITLEILKLPVDSSPFTVGEPDDYCFVNVFYFFVGDVELVLFLPDAVDVVVVDPLLTGDDEPPFFRSFYLVSYTKSTAY
jgi:hypothetical protein